MPKMEFQMGRQYRIDLWEKLRYGDIVDKHGVEQRAGRFAVSPFH